ncbi:hypothetical protein [Natranaeroarchaeum aerophilus]|uniref:Uncharacterized protein n=1 Tax=Natranaeroarchaeum aerophilus TaxID=2917711 RepID=A0AAE3FRN8_9EURY|nr:hypothetical protein [Natranaeroarchaeum aerophilus]MCL9814402.1 hypothetical protein [Natranaeroarchaeum aerophilus]
MIEDKNKSDVVEMARNQLADKWTVEKRSTRLCAKAKDSPVCAYVESQHDGSLVVTGYIECQSKEQEDVSVLDFYCTVPDSETAIDRLVEFCESQEEGETVCLSENNVVSVRKFTEAIEDTDAVFAAISEDHLARGLFGVTYHVPVGGDEASVADSLRELDAVEIDGRPFPIRLGSILAGETHLYRRVPLYAEGMSYGPKEVTVEDGVRQVTEFVQNDEDPTPLPSESVTPDRLVEVLVEAGAVAIAVETELSGKDELSLSVWIPDATAYEVVAKYETITVEGTQLDLNWEFCCIDGPNFFQRVPVYADDDIIGLEAVSVDGGVSNLKEYVDDGCPRSVVNMPEGEMR